MKPGASPRPGASACHRLRVARASERCSWGCCGVDSRASPTAFWPVLVGTLREGRPPSVRALPGDTEMVGHVKDAHAFSGHQATEDEDRLNRLSHSDFIAQ